MSNVRSGRLLAGLCVVVLGSAATPTRAEPATTPCPPRWGEPGKPLVTSAETAIAIYVAVERDFFPAADPVGFPQVEAVDRGDWWAVFRYRPAEQGADGELLLTSGGGQLSVRIAKCDGAVSDVHLTR
ncbi:hypothetical protein [Brevundimonas lenta]|uniref:NTF2 fold domain-containing protein n=1 Tax=Brevundimonas lenta TaxID=424796 RepID=A0A7W6JEL3_9CAUL|nr:hypothetical protein [Brevundimonas lenta]MBB4083714.1 hypothetical protein [Brevundimonas lenta]